MPYFTEGPLITAYYIGIVYYIILGGSTVCHTSEDSHTVTVIVQTLADVSPLDTVRKTGASRILRKSELRIHVVNCACI